MSNSIIFVTVIKVINVFVHLFCGHYFFITNILFLFVFHYYFFIILLFSFVYICVFLNLQISYKYNKVLFFVFVFFSECQTCEIIGISRWRNHPFTSISIKSRTQFALPIMNLIDNFACGILGLGEE